MHQRDSGSSCSGLSHGSQSIRCRCDNAAFVAIVRSGTSKHQLFMHLMRCLFFFVAVYQVYLEPVHLPGVRNEAADALSRDNVPYSAILAIVFFIMIIFLDKGEIKKKNYY